MVLTRRRARGTIASLAALVLAPALSGAALGGCAGQGGGESMSGQDPSSATRQTEQEESDLENEVNREAGRPTP